MYKEWRNKDNYSKLSYMIPIVSLLNVVASSITLLIFLRLWQSYKKSRNTHIWYFSLFYLFASIFLLLISVPGILIFDPIKISFAAAVSYMFLYISLAFIGQIPMVPFSVIVRQIVSSLILATGVTLLALNLFYLAPVNRIDIDNFYFYLVQEVEWLRILVGATPIIIGIFIAILFVLEGERIKQNDIKKEIISGNVSEGHNQLVYRSYIIAVGMLTIVVAGVFNFIVYTIMPSPWAFLTASVINIIGWVTIYVGLKKDNI